MSELSREYWNAAAQLNALPADAAPDECWQIACAYFYQIGLPYLNYFFLADGRDGDDVPELKLYSTMPGDWISHYEAAGYVAHDYAVARLDAATGPIAMGKTFRGGPGEIERPSWEVMEEAACYGLRCGIALPLRDDPARASVVSGCGISSPDTDETFEKFLSAHEAELALFMNQLHQRMAIPLQRAMEGIEPLSPREREYLTWLAAGLRPEQIADKCQRRPTTIRDALARARRKLNAPTPEAAVATAIRLQLIRP